MTFRYSQQRIGFPVFRSPDNRTASVDGIGETVVPAGKRAEVRKHTVLPSEAGINFWVGAEKVYREPARQRDRLLACIPEDDLSLRSKVALEKARASATLMANEPYFKIGGVSQAQFTPDDWLGHQGIDTDTGPNRQLLDAKAPLTPFESKYLNDTPPVDEADAIVPSLRGR